MRPPRLLLAATAHLPLLACEEGIDCTTEARASVQLTVVDAAGATIPDASATYTIESESWPAPQDCEDLGGGTLVCGWEVEDTFHIEVEAPGYAARTLEVEVGGDECHVITEQVEVVLDPA
ncbi:hypothetical protein L6R53_11130 [Myxococcota bacterium]|nr:hypothetical protein [Myxococcota bacterium]